MINRQFAISAVVMFIMAYAIGFLVHGMLLQADYAKLRNLMRPMAEMTSKLPYLVVAHALFALGFAWIYLKGREKKPWLPQGVRYGVAIAVLMTIPTYLIYHAVAPFPIDLVIKQIIFDTIGVVLMGIVLAWLNR